MIPPYKQKLKVIHNHTKT